MALVALGFVVTTASAIATYHFSINKNNPNLLPALLTPQTVMMGNGDIQSYEQSVAMHEAFGVEGVMIGRGIFTNPWVFEKNNEQHHEKKEYLEVLLKHVRLHHDTWGDSKRFEALKKFFKMYVRDFDDASELRQRLMECHTAAEVSALIEQESN